MTCTDINNLISSIGEQHTYFKKNRLYKLQIGDVWYQRLIKNLEKLKSNPKLIVKYHKLGLTGIGDNSDVSSNLFANILPSHRAKKRYYDYLFNELINHHHSAIELLQKYPADKIGERGLHKNRYKGKKFTLSLHYLYHIEKLAIFNEMIKDKLTSDFIACDIGSNDGLHSMLMKKEFPDASFVLVDFPEHLLYAEYYLRSVFKNAKIATFKDIKDLDVVTRSFIKSFDFVLVPAYLAERLDSGSVDIVTNFASLGEMTKEWFSYYMNSEFFKHAEFFFHHNRIHKDYGYGYAITILDYPHSDFETILFEVSPLFQFVYSVNDKIPLLVKKTYHQPLFNFVGKRKNFNYRKNM